MRREELYLRDIAESASHVASFVKGHTRASFEGSELVRSAVVQKLAVIGEAAAHLSDSMRALHPEVPWNKVTAFRNILVHAYFGIDWDIVWHAATKQCPHLQEQIEAILAAEF
jgi:uncharacterized protein with HEPN domain